MKAVLIGEINQQAFESYIPKEIYARLNDNNIVAIGAVEDDYARGVLISRAEGETVDILWVFVNEQDRKRGMARMLLSTLEEAATKGGATVLRCAFTEFDQPVALEALFRSSGYEVRVDEDGLFYFPISELPEGIPGAGIVPKSRIIPLSKIPDFYLNQLSSRLKQAGNILLELPINRSAYLPDSAVALANGKIDGICLVRQLNENMIELSYLYVEQKVANITPALLDNAIAAVREKFAPTTFMVLLPIQESLVRIMRKLVPKALTGKVYATQKPCAPEKAEESQEKGE